MARDWYNELWYVKREYQKGVAGCPECGQPTASPNPLIPCTCGQDGGLLLYIPPGTHVHIDCPRHGKVTLSGGLEIYC